MASQDSAEVADLQKQMAALQVLLAVCPPLPCNLQCARYWPCPARYSIRTPVYKHVVILRVLASVCQAPCERAAPGCFFSVVGVRQRRGNLSVTLTTMARAPQLSKTS